MRECSCCGIAQERMDNGALLFPHLTVRALSMVSAVVNVLLTMTTSVVSWRSPFSARATSTGSTFARKRRLRPRA